MTAFKDASVDIVGRITVYDFGAVLEYFVSRNASTLSVDTRRHFSNLMP